MCKWAVAFLLLVALVQVPDVLSRSAGHVATTEEKQWPGYQAALTGLFSWSTKHHADSYANRAV